MKWSDEDLMAYGDDELDAARRRALDAALAADAMLRDRMAALGALRQRVASAYAGVLDEPVPDRLSALLAARAAEPARPGAAVVDLAAARGRRPQRRALPGWALWGGMAASVAVGVLLGSLFASRSGGDALLAEQGGQVVAGGPLAQALDAQLASDTPADSKVAVQLSFVDRGGRYCRTFSTARIAGLACREAAQWAVVTAARVDPAAAPAMRQAATSLPRAVLDAVDERIAGDALNAAQERDARGRAWQR